MRATIADNSRLVLAFHVRSREVGYDLRQAVQSFDLIHDLGGNGIRFDLSWFDVEPERSVWDRAKIEWYKDLFREAVHSHGITPIALLIGLPRWASRLMRRDKRAFLEHWRQYCERAIEMMDGHVHLIQVWNEPNNPVLQVAEPTNPDVGILSYPFFYDLLNVTSAILRPQIKPLELIVNVTADLPRWEHFITRCIRHADQAFDMIGLDCYPGTYFPTDWHQFTPLVRTLERVNDPSDLWFGKQAALIEFGYSTFIPRLRTEMHQREWAETVLKHVREQDRLWRDRQGKSLRLISWYELYDEPVQIPFNFLAHFGIVRQADGKIHRKPAYHTLRSHFRAWRDEYAAPSA
jgi:hypothetical protein